MTRIVIGYDGSDQSHDALALGAAIAETRGAEVVLATAFPHMLPSVDHERYATSLARESDPLVADALSRLPESAQGLERRATGGVPAAQGLRDIARSEDADLVVVGSTHRGAVGRVVLPGSVGEVLLEDAPAVGWRSCRADTRSGSDGRHASWAAAFDATHESKRAVSFDAGRTAVDLMVIGTHGSGRLLRLLLGSVAGTVVRHAPWPVVVVPPAARIEFGDPRELGDPSVSRRQRLTRPGFTLRAEHEPRLTREQVRSRVDPAQLEFDSTNAG